MRNRLSLAIVLLVLLTNSSYAQMVGTNCYLQGAYVEIGIIGNGSFGAPAPPGGYHPHFGSLAEVYDYGHDGWTVGVPAYMGDYTYPGSPFEGWEIQANGQRTQAYQYTGTGYLYSGGGTMTGSGLTSYSNTGGVIRNMWGGAVYGGALAMRMETRVDTTASAVVMTVWMKNTGLTTIPAIYYWRSCDPDNDETWPGGSFPTHNVINWQVATPGNPKHKVSVTGTGYSSTAPPLTLCTKDSRAVAVIYGSWGLTVGQDLAAVWSMTYGGGGAFYNVGVDHPGDIGIGIVWNLCNLDAGDSTSICYAYVFNGPAGIDDPGAIPDPKMTILGVPVSTTGHDTLDGCLYPGVDSIAVDIPYGDSKAWVTGHWTWTPGTGLTATTGTHVYVRLTMIPGDITYTVIGHTDTGSCIPGLTDTFIFTVHSCHLAYSNDPCLGDPIYLGMRGDSLGATYHWWGPAGFTSFVHNPVIYPSVWADTGTYYVDRVIGGVHDTDFIHVIIHPLPQPGLMSNFLKQCDNFTPTLNLSANIDSLGETFLWTGPNGFTSTQSGPIIAPFDSLAQGIYVETSTTIWGCHVTETLPIWAAAQPSFTFTVHPGCNWDTVYFLNTTYNADTYVWSFDDGSPQETTRNIARHIYVHDNQVHHVVLEAKNNHCDSTEPSVPIDLMHSIHAQFAATPDTLCLDAGASVTMVDASTAYVDSSGTPVPPTTYAWYYADGTPVETGVSGPLHVFNQAGRFPVKLVVSDIIGCQDSITRDVYVLQLKIHSFQDTLLCISQPLAMKNVIDIIPDMDIQYRYVYSWTESAPNLSDLTVQTPFLNGIGDFTDVLTVTIAGVVPDGCPVSNTMVVHSVLGKVLSHLTVSATIDFGTSIQLNADNEVLYTWVPDDGSLSNPNINNPIASPSVTTTYTVYGYDGNGCMDSANITIYVDTSAFTGIPTAFSPNNDGNNDIFKLTGSRFDRLVEMRVFNRWGEEMFYSNNKEMGWDGKFHGVPQDLGVYNYLVIVAKPGGGNVTYKGNITLIR